MYSYLSRMVCTTMEWNTAHLHTFTPNLISALVLVLFGKGH